MSETVSVDAPTAPHESSGTRYEPGRRRRTRPPKAGPASRVRRDDVIDGGFVLVLVALALVGFHGTFDGIGAQVVGMAGALGAVLVAWLAAWRRLSPLATLGAVLAVFVAFAGPATPDQAVLGVLPGPGTLGALLGGIVSGWKDVVTTAPPVGLADGLGVAPYTTGFAAALVGGVLAFRTAQPLLPAAPVAVATGIAIVLGDRDPVSVLAQGAGFVVLALAWAAMRGNRDRRSADGEIYWPRIHGGLLMLVAVTAGGLVVGSGLPFVSAEDRYVAREHVIPPFDPRDYPSPLAAFRQYRLDLKDEVLFTVDGLPEGARIRLAAMDAYDGIVWRVSGSDASGSGRFERVGSRLLPVPAGAAADVEVTVGHYSNVWMPTVGRMRSMHFDGPNRSELQNVFRYNRATGTGAMPIYLVEGDRYSVSASVEGEVDEASASGRSIANVVLPSLPADESMAGPLGAVQKRAVEIAGGETSPYGQAKALEGYFQAQAFSDGGPEATGRAQVSSGHSMAAIEHFLDAKQQVGNGEHYAATMALMARQLGLPARVVVGFAPEGAGRVEVTGADADAWVEIAFDGVEWLPFHPTPDEDNEPDQETTQTRVEEELSTQEPQDDPYLEPPDEFEELDRREETPETPVDEATGGGFRLPRAVVLALRWGGPPVGLFGLLAASVVGAKALRRRRRRRRGTVVERAAGGWRELTDQLRDQGHRLAAGTTRVELTAATADAWSSGTGAARHFDAVMFGPSEPTEGDIDELWRRVEDERSALRAGLTRRQRLRAALSTASLRPGRARPTGGR